MALVALFVLAFGLATGAQIKRYIDDAAETTIAAQASTAALIAERVNANLAIAAGAATGAAELARTGGGDVVSLANAAAHTSPATAAAVIGPTGAIEAITDAQYRALAIAAAQAAGDEQLWTGAPDMGELATTPAIVRRLGDRRIVTIIDPARLLPELAPAARVLIASPSGHIFYASPALQSAGPRAQQQVLAAARANGAGALIEDGAGAAWAAAEANVQLGGFRVMAASPAPNGMSLLLRALLQYALIAAAPLAAMGVLYLLMRQNAQRARLAEAEAVRAETHFRIAADGAKVGVLEWRPGADEVQLSEQAARLLGAPRDTISLRELLELIVSEDRFGVDEEFRRARQSGLLDARFRVSRAGGLAWIEARGAAVEDASGRAETRLFATVIDATQRHEAEARVTRLERQLRAAIDNFSGPFALWDSRKRLLLWNQSFAVAFKLGPDMLRPRASYEAIAAASTPAIRREKHDPSNPDVRVIELVTGEWLHVVERRAADGGVITVGVDITPLKRKEEELARNERRLSDALTRAESQEYRIKALAREAHEERQKAEEASRAKSTFLANMSHELRTPLNAVIGFSEALMHESATPDARRIEEYAGAINEAGRHLLALINDILDVARIEAGRMDLAEDPVDLARLAATALRLLEPVARTASVSLALAVPKDLPAVLGDERRLRQVLLNLVSNAVKFTGPGGSVRVEAGLDADGGLEVRVADSGIGIAREDLERVFQPFVQLDSSLSRRYQGSGLGLFLSRALAQAHGGTLTLESEPGKGTTALLRLPPSRVVRRVAAAQ